MSDIQTMTEAASPSGETDDRGEALRFTPLRSHVIARTSSREDKDALALSRIIPRRRFQN